MSAERSSIRLFRYGKILSSIEVCGGRVAVVTLLAGPEPSLKVVGICIKKISPNAVIH